MGRRCHRPVPQEVRRVLAVVHGGIGDRLMTLPALRALRTRWPGAVIQVAWCGEPLPVQNEFGSFCVIGKNSFVDQWRLMRQGWDVLFVNSIGMHSVVTELASGTSGIPVRIGPRWPGSAASSYTKPFDADPGVHVTAINVAAVVRKEAGQPVAYPVQIAGGQVGAVRHNAPVLLHVGCRPAYSGYEQNRWPLDRFEQLAGRIVKELNRQVCVLVGPDESSEMRRQLGGWPARILEPHGLEELFSVVGGAALLVGNDSGPAHVAAAVGTPEVVMFGPSNPHRSAPVSDKALLVCSGHPRAFRYGELPAHIPGPMDAISVDTVMETVRVALSTFG